MNQPSRDPAEPKVSFIVPAHNEQACIGATIDAIHRSAVAVGGPYEVIVVDDASTDATAAIARERNATVVQVNHRQIAATRNAGARAARGERLFFIDADTQIHPGVVAAAMRAMDRGAAGGGALAWFDEAPLYARILLAVVNAGMRLAGFTGGACMFATRRAFEAVGGYDERLFGAEDAVLSLAIKQEGRFAVVWPHVLTSGRRMRGGAGLRMIGTLFRMAFFPGMLKQRAAVNNVWYDSNRDRDNAAEGLRVRLFNAFMLLFVAALLPIWIFVPWSWTPRDSALGMMRIGRGVILCHVGLALWPCAYLLTRSLLRQKRWIERIKLALLIAACVWLAWGGTRVVIDFWAWVFQRLFGFGTAP